MSNIICAIERELNYGRLQIPKPYLEHIGLRSGETVQIIQLKDHTLLLRSPHTLEARAALAAEDVRHASELTGLRIAATDNTQIIAASEGLEDLIGKSISSKLRLMLARGESLSGTDGVAVFLSIESEFKATATLPITCGGEPAGALVAVIGEDGKGWPDTEQLRVLNYVAQAMCRYP